MLLAPGPIPTLSATVDPAILAKPGFGDLVATETAPLPGLLAAMDALITAEGIIDLLPPDDGIGPILDPLNIDLATFSAFPGDAAAAQLDVSQTAGAALIENAYRATPAEAFQPVPPSIDYQSGATTDSGTVGITVGIANLTRPGWNGFYPGDTYQITAHVNAAATGAGNNAGIEVNALLIQNGVIVPLHDLGASDAAGDLVCTGIMQDNSIGDWTLYVFSGTTGKLFLFGQTIAFTVYPLPAPYTSNIPPGQVISAPGLYPTCTVGQLPQGAAITVTLTNTSGGSNTAFRQGDTWRLDITGPATDEIVIWATENGAALPKYVLGKTGFDGTFSLTGVFDLPDYIGVWSEFYQVGTEVWPGQLNFTVSGPAAALGPSAPVVSAPVITQGSPAPTPFAPGGIFGGGTAPPASTAPGLGPGGILGGGTLPPAPSAPGLAPGAVLG